MDEQRKQRKKAYDAARYQEKRDAIIARVKERYLKKTEAILAWHHEYYKRNFVRINARTKAWREANLKRKSEIDKAWREANLEHARARGRAYQKANLQKWRISWNKRRARKLAGGGKFTEQDVQKLLLQQKFRCINCKKDIRRARHIDHIMPLYLGGSNDASNIQLLCPFCNVSKGRLHPDAWAKRQGRLL